MIRRETIDGRDAFVAFLNADFDPVDEADATLLKVIFDDGGVLFLKADTQEKDYNESEHPRDEHGRWTDAGEGDDEVGPSDSGGRDTPESDKFTAYAEQDHPFRGGEGITEVTGSEDGGFSGFLTPRGRSFDVGPMAHETAARNAGTSIFRLLQEGTARIYVTPSFIGIETGQRPTKQQIGALIKAASTKTVERFTIDHLSGKNFMTDVLDAHVTALGIRDTIDKAFPQPSEGSEGEPELPMKLPTQFAPSFPAGNAFVEGWGSKFGRLTNTSEIGTTDSVSWMQEGQVAELKNQAATATIALGDATQEYAVIVATKGDEVNTESGTRVAVVAGDEHSVGPPKFLMDALDHIGASYAFYHNHPLPCSLSLNDIRWMNAKPRIESVRADDSSGGWSEASMINRNALVDFDTKAQRLYADIDYRATVLLPSSLAHGREGHFSSATPEVRGIFTFLEHEVINQSLASSGVIKYETHYSEWQRKYLDQYSKEFAAALDVGKKIAALIPWRENKRAPDSVEVGEALDKA